MIAAFVVARKQNRLRRDEMRVSLFELRRETIRRFDEISGEWWRDARLSEEKLDSFRRLIRDIELVFDAKTFAEAADLFQHTVLQQAFERHARDYSEAQMEQERRDAIKIANAKFQAIIEKLPELRALLVKATEVGSAF